jgi:AcrR family transcriptional regulator
VTKKAHLQMADSTNDNDAIPSVWLRDARTPRGDRPALSQERIVQAAIELLDQQGLDGLSLRRLAEYLGSGVTSLYWYVKTKEDLLELALDAILANVPVVDEASVDWKANVRTLTGWLRGVILQHPWSAPLFGSFVGIGPNALAYAEAVLNALDRVGLSPAQLNGGLSAVFHYVIGSAITDAAWITTLRRAGIEQEGWNAIMAANTQSAVENNAYAVVSYLQRFGTDDPDRRFEMGLEAILNGLEQWFAKQ